MITSIILQHLLTWMHFNLLVEVLKVRKAFFWMGMFARNFSCIIHFCFVERKLIIKFISYTYCNGFWESLLILLFTELFERLMDSLLFGKILRLSLVFFAPLDSFKYLSGLDCYFGYNYCFSFNVPVLLSGYY